MSGHRKHAEVAAVGGGLAVGLASHYSQHIEYLNPGMKEIVILMICTVIGGLIADVEQRFSVAATALYISIFISIEALLITGLNRFLSQYIDGFLQLSVALILITAVSFGIALLTFIKFQRIVGHKDWHSILYSIGMLIILSVGFLVQHIIGPKPEIAKTIVAVFFVVFGNLTHVIIDVIP